MNYFSKNKIITIILVILMVINVTALITIAARGRFFQRNMPWHPRMEYNQKEGKRSRIDQRDSGQIKSRKERPGAELGRGFSDRFARRLDLSSDQQEAMKAVWEQNREKMGPLSMQMKEARRQLNAAMGSMVLNEDSINMLNEEIVGIDKEIRKNLLDYNKKVRALLNEEQLERYLEMHRNMMNRDGSRAKRSDK